MAILSRGNGGPTDELAVRQLQIDVDQIKGDIADIKQTLALLPRALERLDHVIDQGDRLIEATAGPDGVPAWHATLGALGQVVSRLSAIEQATAAVVAWVGSTDRRFTQLAGQAQRTERMTIVALVVIGATKVANLVVWWRRPEAGRG